MGSRSAGSTRSFRAVFAGVDPSDWNKLTDKHPKSWTVFQTLAHLDSIAQTLDLLMQSALRGGSYTDPDFSQRKDLAAFNEREIRARKPDA